MPITIRFERKDENGNIYYEDKDGNRIPDATPEEIAEKEAERQRLIAESNRIFFENLRKQQPFWLRPLGNLQKPKEGKALWQAAPTTYVSGHSSTPTVYWSERELCILAGDNGVGKSLMALQVARELVKNPLLRGVPNEVKAGCVLADTTHLPSATPRYSTDAKVSTVSPQEEILTHPVTPLACHPSQEGISSLNKVLYIDWELTEEDFVRRWGGTEVPENFFWAGFNADFTLPEHVKERTHWLIDNFATTVRETGANIVIIDQPDRLHLSPQKWNDFLVKLKGLMQKYSLSVMIVLSNKTRHLSRPCGLNNVPKGNILIPCADSVVMMAQNQRRTCERYFKVLKNRNRALAENLEFVDIIELENLDGYLHIHPWGYQRERDMLPPNAAERKNQRIMEAEKLWNSGLSCLEVGEQMMVAESTVKGWLRPLISGHLTSNSEKYSSQPFPLPRGEGRNATSPHLSPNPSPTGEGSKTPPTAFGGHPLLAGYFAQK